jgi:CHAT domain-containing protein/Tfp pilus assembly protein PilF
MRSVVFLPWLLGLAAAGPPAGVVVEDVQPGLAAQQAGLQPGDVLLAWERAATPANPDPARGELTSPFDVDEVAIEQAPRGALTLSGTRDGQPLLVRMPPGDWGLSARPPLDSASLATYEDARKLIGGEQYERGLSSWRGLGLAWSAAGDHARAAWLLYRVARVAAERRSWATADEALGDARRVAVMAGDSAGVARVIGSLAAGEAFRVHSEWERAVAADGEALEAQRKRSPTSLGEALILDQLGWVALTRADLASADDYQRRALAIREKLAPDSLEVATSLFALGVAAWTRADLVAAEQYHRRALEMRTALSPESPAVASSLNNLGLLTDLRGDLPAAEELYLHALGIQERLTPHSLKAAATLHNLGRVAGFRGDLAAAEDYYRRSLAIKETLAPVSLTAANSLTNLASVASLRGELAVADDYNRRALAIMEKVAPESPTVATILGSLGVVAGERGDSAAAEGYLRRALAMREKIAPDSVETAEALHDLAAIARKHGDVAQARGHLQRAFALTNRVSPRSGTAATVMRALGDMALEEGDLATAAVHFRASLDVRTELAPGSADEAESYQRLAVVERRRGRPDQALPLYRSALDALDAQRGKLGGTDEVRAGFGARYAGYYREALDLLMERGRAEEAFHVLERYRARGLLALLAERDLVFSADVTEELDRERRLANAEYDRALAALADPKAGSDEEKREALRLARVRRTVVQSRIRAASPRLAALQYPQPLDLAATREALAAGTALLSYSIGDDKSYLFAVGPGPDDFVAMALDTRLATLRDEVGRFRQLLHQPGPLLAKRLQLIAHRLGSVLLAPVAQQIRRAERLLILPDGPLHLIPFAALADPAPSNRFHYLVEAKPVHVAASATVFAELTKNPRAERSARLVAFGDPDYSAVSRIASASEPSSTVRRARERGLELRALPASRKEVAGLARHYPASSRTYLGSDATEERAKTIGAEASLLHFACHGLAEETSPLDSSLALSLPGQWRPGRDNGLLQAWEIFEQMRIDADLVTLSACSTALGKEMSGEGILGLTRAFQYAGARSVLASLWEVDEASTADLMTRFYGHLKDGLSKDAALRAAQLELLRRPGASSHPHRWAAFELFGAWK